MDDIIEAIRALIDAGDTGNVYKKIYYGENKVPAEQEFPFVEVIPNSTMMEVAGTGGLRKDAFSITINIKSTLKKSLTANTNKEVIAHMQDLVKKMEERTSGVPKATTILGILSADIKLSTNVDYSDDFTIEYTTSEYGASWIVIASLTFTCKLLTP